MEAPAWVIAGCLLALVVAAFRIRRTIERINQTPGMTPNDINHVTERVQKNVTKLDDLGKQ